MPLAGTRRHNAFSDPHTYEKPHLRSSNLNFFSPTIGVRSGQGLHIGNRQRMRQAWNIVKGYSKAVNRV